MSNHRRTGADAGEVINASELGEYGFCRRAWWLGRVQGLPSAHVEALARGSALHASHGLDAQRNIRLQRMAISGLVLALIMVGLGLLLALRAAFGGSF